MYNLTRNTYFFILYAIYLFEVYTCLADYAAKKSKLHDASVRTAIPDLKEISRTAKENEVEQHANGA